MKLLSPIAALFILTLSCAAADVTLKDAFKDDFLVGALFWTTRFHVTQPPHLEDKTWRMTSDGVSYSRP